MIGAMCICDVVAAEEPVIVPKGHKEAGEIYPTFDDLHEKIMKSPFELDLYSELVERHKETVKFDSEMYSKLVSKEDRDEAKELADLGSKALKAKMYDQAKEHYEDSIKKNPYDAGSHNSLTHALMALKEYRKSENAMDVCLLLGPNKPAHFYNRGAAAWSVAWTDTSKDEEKVEMKFRRALFFFQRYLAVSSKEENTSNANKMITYITKKYKISK
jgi:tetratricopeptide (TPR) repeat protein